MGAMYMECSSKEMIGVHEIFDKAIDTVVAEQEGLKIRSDSVHGDSSGNVMPPVGKRKKRSTCKIL